MRLKRINMPPDAATTPDAAKALGLRLKEAEAKAETARDQAAREMLREVAELWRKLADQVEKRGW